MAGRVMTLVLLLASAVLGAALVLSAALYNDAMYNLNPDQPARAPAPVSDVR